MCSSFTIIQFRPTSRSVLVTYHHYCPSIPSSRCPSANSLNTVCDSYSNVAATTKLLMVKIVLKLSGCIPHSTRKPILWRQQSTLAGSLGLLRPMRLCPMIWLTRFLCLAPSVLRTITVGASFKLLLSQRQRCHPLGIFHENLLSCQLCYERNMTCYRRSVKAYFAPNFSVAQS